MRLSEGGLLNGNAYVGMGACMCADEGRDDERRNDVHVGDGAWAITAA